MAIVATTSNHFKFMQATKKIDFAVDTFKVILMNSAFAFNKDTHATLADVTASQLATNYGYTQNGYTLAGVSVTEDDTNDRATVSWTNIQWDASGGAIGPTGSLIVYDDTTTDDTVVGCIDFGVDYTVADGSSIIFQNLVFNSN